MLVAKISFGVPVLAPHHKLGLLEVVDPLWPVKTI